MRVEVRESLDAYLNDVLEIIEVTVFMWERFKKIGLIENVQDAVIGNIWAWCGGKHVLLVGKLSDRDANDFAKWFEGKAYKIKSDVRLASNK